ncbi:cation:proton antiporter [Planctomicrobium sp. SH664]|uniref:cation:proton antiporter n=1 Tax=Planctomicrobium sp. SH664 TaxID=3448125 RepID=UPI003F5B6C09
MSPSAQVPDLPGRQDPRVDSHALGHVQGMLAYGLMLLVGVGGFLVIREIGESQFGPPVKLPPVPAVAAAKAASVDVVAHVLGTMAAVIVLGYVLGRLMRRIGQPPVIGEVVAGICLGPSLLGALSPEAMSLLIPSAADDPQGQVTAALKMIAQLGVILYMFVVGLDLNAGKLKNQVHAAIAISHVGIIVPFLLGAMLALVLHREFAPNPISFTGFSLFMGLAMAITAFPVLARILTDRGLEATPLGTLALTCAAADDATAWCLLAVVVGIVQTRIENSLQVLGLALVFTGAMFLIVKPVLRRWCARMDRSQNSSGQSPLVVGMAGALLAAMTTELIGIHAIFGAFLLGAVIPNESRPARELKQRLHESVIVLLLPAFFAYTGMRTQIGLVSGLNHWLLCCLIIVVATLGKFGGTFVAARATGINHRDAATLGMLMNTRGLMELIVLNIGLDLGVISPTLFAMMVLMALVTTLATSPMLGWLNPEFVSTENPERTRNNPEPVGSV